MIKASIVEHIKNSNSDHEANTFKEIIHDIRFFSNAGMLVKWQREVLKNPWITRPASSSNNIIIKTEVVQMDNFEMPENRPFLTSYRKGVYFSSSFASNLRAHV